MWVWAKVDYYLALAGPGSGQALVKSYATAQCSAAANGRPDTSLASEMVMTPNEQIYSYIRTCTYAMFGTREIDPI